MNLLTSAWASAHPKPARWLLAGAYVMYSALALAIGLAMESVPLPVFQGFAWVAALLAAFGLAAYFFLKKWAPTSFPAWRKPVWAALLIFGGAIFALNGRMGLERGWQPATESRGFVHKAAAPSPAHGITAAFDASLHAIGGHMARPLKKMQEKLSDGARVALYTLLMLGCSGLLTLSLAWSCSLSCNGYQAASALVFFGGLGISIFLAVWLGLLVFKLFKTKKGGPFGWATGIAVPLSLLFIGLFSSISASFLAVFAAAGLFIGLGFWGLKLYRTWAKTL